MTAHLNSESWDSGGNLIVPRHGIRTAMFFALFPTGIFCYLTFLGYQQQLKDHPYEATRFHDPLWMVILWSALPLVPFIVSMVLLSGRSQESKGAGAGVAAVLFAWGIFWSVLLFFAEFYFRLAAEPYIWQELVAILVFFPCSVWILISAFRIASKAGWGVFFLAAAATMVCMVWASHSLDSTDYKLARQFEQRRIAAESPPFYRPADAEHNVALFAGCLLLNHSAHPERGFPASLDAPPPDWSCDIKFLPSAVKEYTMHYIPQVDPADGQVVDFQVLAIPMKKGAPGYYAFMVDRRGLVFSDTMWGISGPRVRAATSEARTAKIEELSRNMENYMQQNSLTAAPVSLNPDAIRATYGAEAHSGGENGTGVEVNNYVVYYLAPKAANPSRFALSVQCQSYGENCLRSYFLDYGGILHGTGEPRQATADDPPALECEESDSACKDVVWPAE